MRRFVVVGLGHFGSWAARSLYEQGHEVIAIDPNEELVDHYRSHVTKSVAGDATNRELLAQIGAEEADAAIISTGENLAVSVLSTQALQELGVREIYVKVGSIEAARVFETFRVTDTIFPEREAALRLAHRMTSKAVLEYVPIAAGFSIQEVAIPDAWIGKSLRQLSLPTTAGIQVVALNDVLAGTWEVVPDPDRLLRESDAALVAGSDEAIQRALARTVT